ncbi:MAG: hypothetical protein BMS9Abin12_2352 [Acidimicrobiia bacterium]|nr:MAG: hypothetical protein BMS9Abin12_2352 [Acidimicrobiia bacterium]
MVSFQAAPTPIRVGIMCNGRRFPAWQAAAIRALKTLPDVEISLLIIRDAPSDSRSKLSRLNDPSRLLWILFNKGYVERHSRASRAVDMEVELADVPEIRCETIRVGTFGERFSDSDVATILSHDLDVILRFGFGIIKGSVLTAARYGVWSFHHGDEREFRGRPPGFWELREGRPVVGAILQRLTERLDGGVVLHRGFFRAFPHSYLRTRDDAFLGSAIWPSVVVRQIQCGDIGIVEGPASTTDAALRRDPTNGTMARFLLRQATQFLLAQVRGTTKAAVWSVGVADMPISGFLTQATPDIRWIRERGRGRYLADPFAVEHNGTVVALVEDYDYTTHRGVISAVDLEGDNHVEVVLDTGVHASYPYVVEEAGEIYCIPETYQANEVRLYRAVEFPRRWEQVATLVEGFAALDATVFRYDDRWWLFCTNQADGSNSKLHVFYASTVEGPWEPHALNPVKTDIRSSRPAGTPFVHEGTLFRPAQDGSESYGGGVTMTRIDELTPTTFSEQIVNRVHPPVSGRYRDGIHTLSAVGNRTVVDGRRDTFIWAAFRREWSSRLRKLTRR